MDMPGELTDGNSGDSAVEMLAVAAARGRLRSTPDRGGF